MDTRMNAHTGLKLVQSEHRSTISLNEENEEFLDKIPSHITGLSEPIPDSPYWKKAERSAPCEEYDIRSNIGVLPTPKISASPCLDGVDENIKNYINGIIAKNVELEERVNGLEIYVHNLKGISNIWMDRSVFLENRLNISEAEAKFYKRLFEDIKGEKSDRKSIGNNKSDVLGSEIENHVDERMTVLNGFQSDDAKPKYPGMGKRSFTRENVNKSDDLVKLLVISKVTKREADILKIEHDDQIDSVGDFAASSPRSQHSPDILKIEHGEEGILDIRESTRRQCRSTTERIPKRISRCEKKTQRAQSVKPSTENRHDRNPSPHANQAASLDALPSVFKRAAIDNRSEFQIGAKTQTQVGELRAKVNHIENNLLKDLDKHPILTSEDRYCTNIFHKYTKLPLLRKVDGENKEKGFIPIINRSEESNITANLSDKNEFSVNHGRILQISKVSKCKNRVKCSSTTRLPRATKPVFEQQWICKHRNLQPSHHCLKFPKYLKKQPEVKENHWGILLFQK